MAELLPEALLSIYQTVFESMNQGFCLLEKIPGAPDAPIDFRYLLTNPAFEEQSGLRQVVGKTIRQLVPETEDPIIAAYDQVASTGHPVHFQQHIPTLDIWNDVQAFRLKGYDTPRIAVLFANITASKKTEEALHYNHLWLTQAMRSAKAGWATWDLETGQMDWSPEGKAIVGFSSEQESRTIEGLLKRIHPDDRLRVQARATESIAQRKEFECEYRVVHDDGQIRWLQGTGQVFYNPNGKAYHSAGLAIDITERKLAEEKLRESEERLQRAVSVSTVGVIYFDLEGGIHDANDAFQRMSGYDKQDFIHGRVRWDKLTPPEFMTVTLLAQQEYRAKGENTPYEKQYIRPDGSRWWGLFAGKRLSDGEFVEFVLDITESKQAGQALKEADQRKDHFLAMLAHELRNPLASIRLGMSLLSYSQEPDPVTDQTVELVNQQVDLLVRLVDELLDVSRISRGKIQLKLEHLELGALVANTVEAIRPQYNALHKQLHFTDPPGSVFVLGDPTRLTQIVTNLLVNGLRYTGQQGQVWVSLRTQDQEAVLRIADNGIGLTADQLTTIFELFVQVDVSLARSQGGLGIGLTLAQRLVKMHGGRIEAHSPGLGQGSEFMVYLPLRKTPEKEQTAEEKTPTARPAHQRILVIDDNPGLAFMLSQTLKLRGYEVSIQHSGREGIKAAETLRPSVILCDIGMPELDGYETCRIIRQQPWGQEVKIIAITGYGQEEDKRRAREAGFDEHLVKPVDLDLLIRLLDGGPNQTVRD